MRHDKFMKLVSINSKANPKGAAIIILKAEISRTDSHLERAPRQLEEHLEVNKQVYSPVLWGC